METNKITHTKRFLVYIQSIKRYYVTTFSYTNSVLLISNNQASETVEGAWNYFVRDVKSLSQNSAPLFNWNTYDITNASNLEDVHKLMLVGKLIK